MKSRRSADDIATISDETKKRFGSELAEANNNLIRGYMKPICLKKVLLIDREKSPAIDKLTLEIAKIHFKDTDEKTKTFSLFELALKINNCFARYLIKHLEVTYHYELDLAKLLPGHLKTHDRQQKADNFLKSAEQYFGKPQGLGEDDYPKESIDLLRELGALERINI